MFRDVVDRYYFDGNYNCAETILRAGNEYYQLELHDRDMIMVGGYGAGIQSGSVCGAILAGVAVLSMKYIEAKAHESADIHPVVQKLLREFKTTYGSTLCKDIKPQSFNKEYRCRETIYKACDILEAVIISYEEERK